MNRKVVVTTRCPKCYVRLYFTDYDDPDAVVAKHLKECN